jgi:hypothetical protein
LLLTTLATLAKTSGSVAHHIAAAFEKQFVGDGDEHDTFFNIDLDIVSKCPLLF